MPSRLDEWTEKTFGIKTPEPELQLINLSDNITASKNL